MTSPQPTPTGSEGALSAIVVPVFRDKKLRAWPKHEKGGKATYTPLEGALSAFYATDAHLAAYSVPARRRRLDSNAIERLPDGVPMVTVWFDMDCDAAHEAAGGEADGEAPDAWWDLEVEKVNALLLVHPDAFVFRTRGGYRVVYRLAEPVVLRTVQDAGEWKLTYSAWVAYLSRCFGIVADYACADWTRLFRVPHAIRDEGGHPERRPTIGDPNKIGSWNCAPNKEDFEVATSKLGSKKRRSTSDPTPDSPPGESYGVIYHAFKARGWIGHELEAGKWAAACPWRDAHTKGDQFDGSTVVWATVPGKTLGWLHCSHSHCVGRTLEDVLGIFSDLELANARAAADITGGAAGKPFFVGTTFLPAVLARTIQQELQLIAFPCDSKGRGAYIFGYAGGVFRDAMQHARSRVADRLGDRATPKRIDDTLDMIRTKAVRAEAELNPQAGVLINVKNGMLNWRTGELLPHEPGYLSTVRIPITHDSAATDPLLDKVLAEWFPSDALGLAEELIGYLLLPTAKHQVAFMLVGGGSNGKSTFLFLLQEFLGADNVAHDSLQELTENRFRMANLVGKLANIYADIGSGELRLTSKFKAIVGGDPVTAEEKFGASFSFRPYARLIFSANSAPSPGSDTSHGYFRRWVLIPFNEVFAALAEVSADPKSDGKCVPRKDDPELLAKITTELAKSALLNRALHGLRRLEARGHFELPASVLATGEKYQNDSDAVRRFLLDECVTAPANNVISSTDLYRYFAEWCKESGVRFPPKKVTFDEKVESTLGAKKDRQRIGGKNAVWVWTGITCEFQAPGSERDDFAASAAREGSPSGLDADEPPDLVTL